MAINKRKILQSAQKHMQKGALDKALKDYGSLLQADPGDANIRLKVGDIHLKQGKTDEAVESYLKVAQRFMKDGFDSKAIALYKQVTKIDPKRFDIYLPLSELYQRLGLKSDAMRALQTAADAHYREGDKDQALDLLRKMATFDPSNTTNRLKVAELLRQEGRRDEAVAEYDEVVEELERQGDAEERINVLQKILEIDPSRMVTFVALGSAWVEQQNWRQAEATAETMIESFAAEPEGYELLAQIFQELGRDDELQGVYRRLAEVYKDRGDEDHAREIMQRFVSTEALGADENGDPVLEGDDQGALDAAIGGDGTLALEPDECTDPDFLSGEGLRLGEGIGDSEGTDPVGETSSGETTATSLPPLPPLGMESVSEEEVPEPEGDAEQLFAEASVYLRYGKYERAIESLRAVLSQAPGHRPALDKLGEVLVATGDSENAATAFARAAGVAREEGDDAGFESLRAKLEEIDPAAAESLASAAPEVESGIPDDEAPDLSEHLETIDIEVESGVETEQTQETLDADDSIEFEIEDDFELDETPPVAEEVVEPPAQIEEPLPDPDEVEFDLEDAEPSFETAQAEYAQEEIDLTDPEAVAPEPSLEDTIARGVPTPSRSGGSATTPQRMVEDLEEADFYFQQGLFEEAEEVYSRILAAAPNHPQAMLRMGEIEAARGDSEEVLPEPEEDPLLEADAAAAVEEAPPAEPLPEVPLPDLETDVAFPDLEEDVPEPDFDLDAPAADGGAEVEEPAPSALETMVEEDGEADDLGIDLPDASSLPGLDRAAELDLEIDPREEDAAAEPAVPASAVAQAEETLPLVAEVAPPDADADEAGEAGDFDLAAELSGVLDGEDTGPVSAGMAGTTEEEGFEQVFAAFKQGVQQELGDGDLETHYDLGIAYKEMGLLEDAIGEFQVALGAPARKLASLHAMGLCALELERVSDAISHLEQALALPEVPGEQQTALHFDLGRAYEEKGDLARARSAYETVAAADPDFGAVGERLAELERSESSDDVDAVATEEQEETFESFDDLIGAASAEPETESYESFDDLMDEEDEQEDEPPAEFDPPLAEPEATAPELVTEPVSAPEPEAAALAAEPEPDLDPEVAELAAEGTSAPELEAPELAIQPAPELEPEAADLAMEPEPDPETEALEPESEPAAEAEPAAWEFETEPPVEPEPAAAQLEAEPVPDEEARAEESAPAPEPESAPLPEAPAPAKPARRKKISFV